MRIELLVKIKEELTKAINQYIHNEGLHLLVAANDNIPTSAEMLLMAPVEIYALPSTKLLSEIRLTLTMLGKPAQSDAFIEGLYNCLYPHNLTLPELTVLLMTLHIEKLPTRQSRRVVKRAVFSYIVEEDA